MKIKVSVEDFLKNNAKKDSKESKLDFFLPQIIELKSKGLSYGEIVEYLKLNDVDVSYGTVRNFYLARYQNANQPKRRKRRIEALLLPYADEIFEILESSTYEDVKDFLYRNGVLTTTKDGPKIIGIGTIQKFCKDYLADKDYYEKLKKEM